MRPDRGVRPGTSTALLWMLERGLDVRQGGRDPVPGGRGRARPAYRLHPVGTPRGRASAEALAPSASRRPGCARVATRDNNPCAPLITMIPIRHDPPQQDRVDRRRARRSEVRIEPCRRAPPADLWPPRSAHDRSPVSVLRSREVPAQDGDACGPRTAVTRHLGGLETETQRLRLRPTPAGGTRRRAGQGAGSVLRPIGTSGRCLPWLHVGVDR